jgi:general secretion pathway protein K
MRISRQPTSRGIAIIIVMVSVFALAILAGAFAFTMKVENRLAANSNNETQLQWAGRSGIDYVRWCLSLEMIEQGSGMRYDSLDQTWAGGAETNEALSEVQHYNIEIGPGIVIKQWSVTDLERKMNVNSALNNPQMLEKALTLSGAGVTEIPTILASVQDWIDADDDERPGGAESGYYHSLMPPYSAKNGPIDELSEMLLIKGVTPELYWGSDASNHPSPIFGRQIVTLSGLQTVDTGETVKLTDVLTPVSSGAINILTASVMQLQLLPGVDTNVAVQILQLRGERDQGTFLPYASPSDLLVNTSLGRQFTPMTAPYCSFRSPTRQITAVVAVGMSVRTYFAIVRINGPKDIPVLTFWWEDGDQSGQPLPGLLQQ